MRNSSRLKEGTTSPSSSIRAMTETATLGKTLPFFSSSGAAWTSSSIIDKTVVAKALGTANDWNKVKSFLVDFVWRAAASLRVSPRVSRIDVQNEINSTPWVHQLLKRGKTTTNRMKYKSMRHSSHLLSIPPSSRIASSRRKGSLWQIARSTLKAVTFSKIEGRVGLICQRARS